jgi:hypothetical protein
MDEIKTKRRPSWGIYLLLSLLVASVVAIVFGNMSVQQINDELYMTELVERQQYIPFYKWFNGSIEVENPRLDEPISELNNHTLREIFEGGNLVENGDFTFNGSNWNSTGVNYNGYAEFVLRNDFTYIYQVYDISNFALNDKIWVRIEQGNTTTQHIYTNGFNPNTPSSTPYMFPIESYPTTQNNVEQLGTSMMFALYTYHTIETGNVNLDNLTFINQGQFGINNITKSEMDAYFELYQYYKNYTDIPIYDVSAYGVTPQQIEYYYNQYLNYVETMDLQNVYLVYTNPEYNTQIGTTFIVQYQNVTKSVLDTIDGLKNVYEGFKNTLDKIGEFFS